MRGQREESNFARRKVQGECKRGVYEGAFTEATERKGLQVQGKERRRKRKDQKKYASAYDVRKGGGEGRERKMQSEMRECNKRGVKEESMSKMIQGGEQGEDKGQGGKCARSAIKNVQLKHLSIQSVQQEEQGVLG